jgi:hypothetical protein
MKTPVKLAAFAGGLAVAFAAALGAGAAVGQPVDVDQDHSSSEGSHGDAGGSGAHDGMTGMGGEQDDGSAEDAAGGLMVAQSGHRLVLDDTAPAAADDVPVTFRILDDAGEPVRDFEDSHTKDLHLIVVRRDMVGFQHVHPTMDDSGRWSVPVDLAPGTWRVFADFVPAVGDAAGETITLGADLTVAGSTEAITLPAPARTVTIDGYRVDLQGELVPGEESELTLTVNRDGEPVTDLDPYLAAYGHLVALRAGDLAYLHVHPAGEPGDGRTDSGPQITFYATAPSAGDYRLFLDFQHEGVVRTAELTVRAGAPDFRDQVAPVAPAPGTTDDGGSGAGHDADGHDH